MSVKRWLIGVFLFAAVSCSGGSSSSSGPVSPSQPSTPTPASSTPSVTTTAGGKVTDSRTGTSLPGVSVEVTTQSNLRTTTAADGSYSLTGITATTFSIRYSLSAYQTIDRSYTVQLGTSRADLNVQLDLAAVSGTPWSQLPLLSDAAKTLVINDDLNMWWVGNGAVTRWASFPLSVWAAPSLDASEVQAAMNFWASATGGKITFTTASSASAAQIVMTTNWPPDYPIPDNACAAAGPRTFIGNVITSGTADFGFLNSSPTCAARAQVNVIAHELGHAAIPLGGHTTSEDIMNADAANLTVSPELLEVINWLSSVAAGTKPQ